MRMERGRPCSLACMVMEFGFAGLVLLDRRLDSAVQQVHLLTKLSQNTPLQMSDTSMHGRFGSSRGFTRTDEPRGDGHLLNTGCVKRSIAQRSAVGEVGTVATTALWRRRKIHEHLKTLRRKSTFIFTV